MTTLGILRKERAHALKHRSRMAGEWDRTLGLLKTVDFTSLSAGEGVEALRAEVEIWHDLTLDPPRRLTEHRHALGLSDDPEEAYEYMHRVFVGMDPAAYLAMCDQLDGALALVAVEGGPVEGTHIRDMLVELMELGVRSSIRSLEWLERKLSGAEEPGG